MDVSRQVLDALVLSQLDYCLVIWSSAAEKDLNKLQVAQNKAARCALQCSYRTRVTEMVNCQTEVNLYFVTFCQKYYSDSLTTYITTKVYSAVC